MTQHVRAATAQDDAFIAESFRRMWVDNGVPEEDIVEDAGPRVTAFLEDGRERLDLAAFVAVFDDEPVGCAVAQRFAGLYPLVLERSLRDYGYIWGVYVRPEHRRRGIARALTERCADALRELGCTHALLHAAPPGEHLYDSLGFAPTNERRLVL